MPVREEARKTAYRALRRRAREAALQVLYQEDCNPQLDSNAGDALLQEQLRFGQLAVSTEEELAELARCELKDLPADELSRIRSRELIDRARPALKQFVREAKLVQLAQSLVVGVHGKRAELDRLFEQVAENWSLDRMPPTDRNVLRLGAYELLHTDTPNRVAIDAAVDLAKRFGTAQSGPFVNGILDRLMHCVGSGQ